MSVIVGLAVDERAERQLREAAADTGKLTACTRAEELLASVNGTPGVVAVITDLWDVDGRPVAPAVRRLRHTQATLPVIAFCRLTPRTAREIVTMAAAGASAIVLRDQEDLGDFLRTLLYHRRSPSSISRTALGSTAGENKYPWP
jgi:hypothetical protein